MIGPTLTFFLTCLVGGLGAGLGWHVAGLIVSKLVEIASRRG